MKIDISAHIIPPALRKAAATLAGGHITFTQSPVLDSLEERFKVMAKYPDVVQVLSVAHTLEEAGPPKVVYELARIANTAMAEVADKYPDKFAGVAATIPLTDIDAALKETDRVIKDLGCRGIMVSADATRPLDKPEFMALYEKMAGYDLPIWLHPMGPKSRPDYDGEKESKYLCWGLWGWPYQTTLAMTRLAFSGVFDRFPKIKFITHHAGAMLPFNSYRIHNWYDPAIQRKEEFTLNLKKHPGEYFRMFYNDTANAGKTSALMCAHDFFGTDHLLFASDLPYAMPSGIGDTLYEHTIKYVEDMSIPAADKDKIFAANARKLLRIPLPSLRGGLHR